MQAWRGTPEVETVRLLARIFLEQVRELLAEGLDLGPVADQDVRIAGMMQGQGRGGRAGVRFQASGVRCQKTGARVRVTFCFLRGSARNATTGPSTPSRLASLGAQSLRMTTCRV